MLNDQALTDLAQWAESGRKQGGERMLKYKKEDPNTVFLKAFLPDTGEIVGMAKWNIFTNNTIPDPAKSSDTTNYWKSEEEMAVAGAMAKNFLSLRTEAIQKSGGNLISLDILAIDPKYQRNGAGSKLVRWGTQKADELGVDAVS